MFKNKTIKNAGIKYRPTMIGEITREGINKTVSIFLYFLILSIAIKARPILQRKEKKTIFINKISVSLKGSRGK